MRAIFFILFCLLLLPSAFAEDYFADVQIDVERDGTITIDGLTNHPTLLVENSDSFTSKNKKYWLLNITINETFSDYVFDVRLPETTIVNYLKVSDLISIGEQSNSLVITGSGQNEPFSVIAQYSFQQSAEQKNYWWIWFISAGLVILGTYLILPTKKKSTINYKSLTERQLKIIKLIEKSGGHLTQNKLQDQLTIPKASLSRNIDALVRKDILIKEQKGMTNILSIKEK